MKKLLMSLLVLIAPVLLISCTEAPMEVENETTSTEEESAVKAGSEDDDPMAKLDPLNVTGDIAAAGSSTVFPLAEQIASEFKEAGYSDSITIDSIGSGGGFERFCVSGESDIANASRAIKDAEVESCAGIGREPIEFRVGTDALAVVVSAQNDFIEGVTLEELAAIFSDVEMWSDVNDAWPDEEIVRYIPGTDSGTFDYFVEEVFDKNEEAILGAGNTTQSEDDNVLVTGIQDDPNAIGFFGYAYYQENENVLTILEIDGISATQEAVDAAAYPLSRPLYMYSTADIIAEKPQVGAFLNYVLSNVNDVIEDVGYFPASNADMGMARAALAEALSQ